MHYIRTDTLDYRVRHDFGGDQEGVDVQLRTIMRQHEKASGVRSGIYLHQIQGGIYFKVRVDAYFIDALTATNCADHAVANGSVRFMR